MRKKLLIALALFFGLSLVLFLTRKSPIPQFFQGIIQSVYHTPKSALYDFANIESTDDEVSRLREENRKLLAQMSDYTELKKDNEALKSQFEEQSSASSTLLPARIVGFQGSLSMPEVIVIDEGVQGGVHAGMAIVVGKNLVGVVEQVSQKYSSVRLVNNPTFSLVAKTEKTDALGVAKGSGNLIVFDRVAITDTLAKDDILLTRGSVDTQKGGIDPGLIIGKIVSVRKVESEPFQSAQVKSLVDIAHLTRVFVVKN